MHKTLIITLATAATSALAGPLKRDTAETTTYACNPAHSYPNGAQCVSTNGALSLVTPTASSTTTYACNPAHSYPNGAQCVSTNGALSLVTPTASSTTTYACNPAHSYPNGAQCVSTNGALSLVTPTASSTTTYACNPAHSYPNGAQCVSTNGALSLVTPTASSSSKACKATSKASTTAAAVTKTASATAAAQATSKASSSAKACSKKPTTTAAASSSAEASKSSAAQSAASAVSTASASGGQTKIDGLTWTVQDFTRYCSEDKTGCDYNFKITSSDHKLETACTIIRTNVKDAPTENWTNIPCTTGSNVIISWGYSAQFGADHAFGTLVVVDDKEIGYFGVADVNSKPVTKSNPYGSGQFGNLGPNPVYHV